MKRYWFGLAVFSLACVTLIEAQTPPEYKGHDGLVHCVAVSTDGTILATASNDGTVKLWDFKSGKEITILKGHVGTVNSVAFNKDGTIVATGGADGSVKFWNPKDGKTIKDLGKGHPGGVGALAFSPSGTVLATAGADKGVKIWDVKDAKELKSFAGHKKSVYGVAFNKEGTQLASCGEDGLIKVWDLKTMAEVKSLLVDLPKPEIKIDPNKDKTDDKDKKDKKEVKTKKDAGKKEDPPELRDAFLGVVFTPDGKSVLSVGHDKYLRFWSLADGKEAKKLGPTPDWIFGIALSKDGKYVATAGYGGSLRVYDVGSGDRIFPAKAADEKKDLDALKTADQARKQQITYSIVFAPDGKSVVTGQHDLKSGKGSAKLTTVIK